MPGRARVTNVNAVLTKVDGAALLTPTQIPSTVSMPDAGEGLASDLAKESKATLAKMADERGIELPPKATKRQIIAALENQHDG